MNTEVYDFLVVGAGIFGVCTAFELAKKDHSVCLINPDDIPHPLAASTDVSKVVRMEYGTDEEYMRMAIESMERWRQWNRILSEEIYHEVGYLLLAKKALHDPSQQYELSSLRNVEQAGYKPQRLSTSYIQNQLPALNHEVYSDGMYNKIGGFARSGRAVELIAKYSTTLGVELITNQMAKEWETDNDNITAVVTAEGRRFKAKEFIVCAGNFSSLLVPDLKPYLKVTGHPVFHIKPSKPELFEPPNFAVFAADIANSGWYGFPLHPEKAIVKVALHSDGLELDPTKDERVVYDSDIQLLKEFLAESLPSLLNDPVVYTRRCCYTDSQDGHFWIDRHPTIKNLTIGTGGTGHGFKMGPVVGEMIAQRALNEKHKWSNRYDWRQIAKEEVIKEEARYFTS